MDGWVAYILEPSDVLAVFMRLLKSSLLNSIWESAKRFATATRLWIAYPVSNAVQLLDSHLARLLVPVRYPNRVDTAVEQSKGRGEECAGQDWGLASIHVSLRLPPSILYVSG